MKHLLFIALFGIAAAVAYWAFAGDASSATRSPRRRGEGPRDTVDRVIDSGKNVGRETRDAMRGLIGGD